MMTEGSRDVPVRLVAGYRCYRTTILGVELRANFGISRRESRSVPIPRRILLTDRLAERLDVGVGDTLVVETWQGTATSAAFPSSASSAT